MMASTMPISTYCPSPVIRARMSAETTPKAAYIAGMMSPTPGPTLVGMPPCAAPVMPTIPPIAWATGS